MGKAEKRIRLGGTLLCEAFTVFTIIMLFSNNETERTALAFATILLILLPLLFEKVFCCHFCLPVYIFALTYAVGPMLGQCWKFYYTIPVWDKLLHISGGLLFAILGAHFFNLMVKGEKKPAASAIFALCFSMAIAVLWEFCEFGADRFLGMDMQDDTVIHGITSYLLGDALGVTGSITNIDSVIINGMPLPVNGYIDIGLIDSMLDMLLETVGAVVICVFLLLDKGRHPLIKNKKDAANVM